MQEEPDVHELKAWKMMMKEEHTKNYDGMGYYCCLTSESFDGIEKSSDSNCCYSHRKWMGKVGVEVEVTTAVGVKGGKHASNMQTRGLTEAVAEQGSYKLRTGILQTVEDSVATANWRTRLRTVHGEAVGRGPWVAGGVQMTRTTGEAMVELLDEKVLEAEGDYAADLWRW